MRFTIKDNHDSFDRISYTLGDFEEAESLKFTLPDSTINLRAMRSMYDITSILIPDEGWSIPKQKLNKTTFRECDLKSIDRSFEF